MAEALSCVNEPAPYGMLLVISFSIDTDNFICVLPYCAVKLLLSKFFSDPHIIRYLFCTENYQCKWQPDKRWWK